MRPFAKRKIMAPIKSGNTDRLDRVAIALSGLCLLHCLAIPVALVAGPLLGQWLIDSETEVHWLLLAMAFPLSVVALFRGYRRHHDRLTLLLGSTGLALMFIGVSHLLGDAWEVLLTVVGVSALLFAHVRNMLGIHQHSHS